MKLYVNEKLFSISHIFYIKNENDEDVYQISSEIMTIGKKTTVNDMNGNKVAYIEQELFHLTPNYNVYIDGVFAFKITKELHLLKNNYVLSNGYKVFGSYLNADFSIYDDKDNEIGSITRKLFHIGDKYEINILDLSKKEIILAIIVAITNDVNRRQREH